MNTSKQVNAMIGLLFLSFLVFGAYIVNEPNRASSAEEAQDEMLVHRGAELFVANCRTCHGLEGHGTEEGALAPPLNLDAFLIFEEGNEQGVEPTAEGEAREIREFLHNTIACGREGTPMPVWSEEFGGPMSDTQINYLVQMITTPGGFDVVAEVGEEHDEEAGVDPATVVLDPAAGGLALTTGNCGQYSGEARQEIISRDPFADPNAEATPEATPTEPEAQTMVQGMLVGDFFQSTCATCHGADRGGGVGLPLLPSTLTQPDQFYIDTIINGRPGTAMPAWGDAEGAIQLTEEEAANLVSFFKNVEP